MIYLAVPFDRGSEGGLVRGQAREAPSADIARDWAAAMAGTHVGAMALSQAVDPDTGAYLEATLLAAFGEVDGGALRA